MHRHSTARIIKSDPVHERTHKANSTAPECVHIVVGAHLIRIETVALVADFNDKSAVIVAALADDDYFTRGTWRAIQNRVGNRFPHRDFNIIDNFMRHTSGYANAPNTFPRYGRVSRLCGDFKLVFYARHACRQYYKNAVLCLPQRTQRALWDKPRRPFRPENWYVADGFLKWQVN